MEKKLRPSIFKRFLALLVDIIVLGIIGYVSGLFLEDFYVSLGKYGTLIGSTVAVIYFSLLQSKIGQGQSIGKRVIGAKVTDLHGNYLTLQKSFLRSFILYFPVMNIEIFSGGNGLVIVVSLLVFITFGSLYFILVNKSRRSLHDLLVSSVVTNQEVTEFNINEQNDHSLKKIIPYGVIGLVLIGMTLYLSFAQTPLSQLLEVKKKIESHEGVITVNEVASATTTYRSPNETSKTVTSIKITVRLNDKDEANLNSKYFNEFYDIIKTEIPESKDVDRISISLYYGYNIGIASKTRKVTKTFER